MNTKSMLMNLFGRIFIFNIFFRTKMKVHLIFGLINASLYVMLTTAKQSSIKQSKHHFTNVKSKGNLHLKEFKHVASSNAEKNSDYFNDDKLLGNGLIWLKRQKHQDRQRQQDKQHRQQEKEERRHQRIINDGRRACSIKRGVLYEGTDEFGDGVQIVPFIGDEGKVRQQVIYETYCMEQHCNCRGVNTVFYESACETNFMLVYAYVIKAGKSKWSFVKVRAGCVCIVREKNHPHMIDAI